MVLVWYPNFVFSFFGSFATKFSVFSTFFFDCNGRVNFLLIDAVASAVKVPVLPGLLLVFEGLLYERYLMLYMSVFKHEIY